MTNITQRIHLISNNDNENDYVMDLHEFQKEINSFLKKNTNFVFHDLALSKSEIIAICITKGDSGDEYETQKTININVKNL